MMNDEKLNGKESLPTLRRVLSPLDAIAIVFGRMIGSGIFRTPGIIMLLIAGLHLDAIGSAGSLGGDGSNGLLAGVVVHPGMFFAAWIIAGVVVYCSALCFSEMVCMFPASGGSYVFLKNAFSPQWAALFGWTMFFVSETASIVTVAYVSAEYASIASQNLWQQPFSTLGTIVWVLSIIWGFTFLNTRGLQISGRAQQVISLIKILSLLGIVLIGLGSAKANPSFLSENFFPPSLPSMEMILALGLAMQFAFFTYSGWEGATYVAEEIKNPQKNLPLSLLLGIGGVMLLYLLVNTSYLLLLGPQQMILEQKQVATAALETAMGPLGAIILALLVMFSTGGNVSTQIMVKARLSYALARDGNFFPYVRKIDEKFHTPNRALYLQAGWASTLLILVVLFSTDFFSTMISFFAFPSALFNIMIMSSVWILRIRQPNRPRHFRVRWLPLVLLPILLVHLWLLTSVTIEKPWLAMGGLAIIGCGWIWYRLRFA